MIRYILLAVFLVISIVNAQPSFTVNNLVKYAEGDRYLLRENVLDVNMFYENWTFYTQIEAGNPPEFGQSGYGIHTIRLDYQSDQLSAELGDVYPLWNHGLSLNLRYERSLGYDSGIRGFNTRINLAEAFRVFAVAGRGDFRLSSPLHNDVRTHDWETTNTVAGTGIQIRPGSAVGRFGLSGLYVRSERPYFRLDENFEPETNYYTVNTQLYEGAWENTLLGWKFAANHVIQVANPQDPWFPARSGTQTDTVDRSLGQATYATVSGLIGGVGVTLEYKNYAYDIRSPAVRNDTHRDWPTRMTSVSRPPIVYRETSATLTSRQTHVVNYNDEIGLQLELTYTDLLGISVMANYALSSRHRHYRLERGTYHVADTRTLFPSPEDAFAPFRQAHLELDRYFLSGNLYLEQALNHLYAVEEYSSQISYTDDNAIKRTINITNGRRAFTSLTKVDYTFTNGNSVSLAHENQWLDRITDIGRSVDTLGVSHAWRDLGSTNIRQAYNRYITFSFRHHEGITMSLIYDYASETEQGEEFNTEPGNDNPIESALREFGVDLRNKWIGIQLTLDFLRNHQITVFYGSEQGGLQCVSGVCRQVAPFEDGFKLTIQSFY